MKTFTDHEIAVRLMALDEGKNVDAWVKKWDDPTFAEWGKSDHSGDCRKEPWTCLRCLYDEYMGAVPDARRLFCLEVKG